MALYFPLLRNALASEKSLGAVRGIWQGSGYKPSGGWCEDQKSGCLYSVVSFPECGHSSLFTGGVVTTGETQRERERLYPESHSRAGTFHHALLQPLSRGTA